MVTIGECDRLSIDIVEEEDESIPAGTSPPNEKNLVEELIGIIQCLNSNVGEYRRTQKKECQSLIRRLQVLLPFLEEIRYFEGPFPESAFEPLNELKVAFHSAKKLLTTCHGASKIYLALETEAIMMRFRGIYDKIKNALESMPYEKLGISDEEKEQVELMSVQLKRAKRRTDTQDMELAMDLMVAVSSSTVDDVKAENDASVERLANKLGLQNAEDLQAETLAIRNLVKERRGQNVESTKQMVDLLNKFQRLAGVPETAIAIIEDPAFFPKALLKCPSLAIPHDFLCPITLEIMTDPVIVSTGQTYEKESIQKWIDSDHRTCPKTGQPLTHLSLAPNFALKNLIQQWCENHKIQLPSKEAPAADVNEPCVEEDKTIPSLVQKLSSNQLDVQRKAVAKIRMLSKESPENRTLIANNGGIKPLVQLLYYPDSRIQEHAVTALLNLSIDETNKKMISKEEPIHAIVEILQKGTVVAKENSAATLFSLSMLDGNKLKIGASNGIPPLIDLLKKGTIRGKKDALTALFNLSLNHSNKSRAIDAGIIAALLGALEDKNLDMSNEILSIFLLFASHEEGRKEIGQLTFVDTLVKFIKDGTPKNKECAIAVLLELGSNNSNGTDLIEATLKYGVHEHLMEVSENGTDRGRRKAKAMLQLVSSGEQNL